MGSHAENHWQRGNKREMLKEARRRYLESKPGPGRECDLASTHWTLIKRYLKGPQKVIGARHMLLAAVHARKACKLGLNSYAQVATVAPILTKTPGWLGGNLEMAEKIVRTALKYHHESGNEMGKMVPHDYALIEVLLAEIIYRRRKEGWFGTMRAHIEHATHMEPEVYREKNLRHAEQQWCRVLKSAGILYCDASSGGDDFYRGIQLLKRAREIARRVSDDQYLLIDEAINKREMGGMQMEC